MDFFSRDYISALRGWCALEFLHTLEINQGLLAHTRRGTGSPPPKKNRENLKFGLQFSVLDSVTSGLTKLFHATCHYCERNFIFLNWFCTRTCGAGRPHAGLCHAHLVRVYYHSNRHCLFCGLHTQRQKFQTLTSWSWNAWYSTSELDRLR